MERASGVVLALVIGAAVGCSHSDDGFKRSTEKVVMTATTQPREQFDEGGVSLKMPSRWSVSGFSETVFPRRLVAASYRVRRADVEGDCGGLVAVERLPSDGAYVVLIEYSGNFDLI